MSLSTKYAGPPSHPINNMPYDVLQVIFTHYLPDFPLADPTFRKAPMILCQVCAAWRMVALTSATFWAHLCYNVTVQKVNGGTEFEYAVLKKDFEFIKWWKTNQRSATSFLAFKFIEKHPDEIGPEEFDTGGSFDFVLGFLATARYLDMTPSCWKHFHNREIVCPNIRSLLLPTKLRDRHLNYFYDAQSVLCLAPTSHRSSLLRHLWIHGELFLQNNIVPHVWCSLTHIVMWKTMVSIGFWHSLIRAAPNLQWGCFIFSIIQTTAIEKKSTRFIHSNLTTLYVLSFEDSDDTDSDISMLFTDIHLPSLQNLSLSTSWVDYRAAVQIHSILKSTPNITTLSVGEEVLSSDEYPALIYGYSTHDHGVDIEPIWTYAPHLEHLELGLPENDEKESIDTVMNQVELMFQAALSPDKWLALQQPACPIRSVTFLYDELEYIVKAEWWPTIDRTYAESTRNVKLRFSSDKFDEKARGEWRTRNQKATAYSRNYTHPDVVIEYAKE